MNVCERECVLHILGATGSPQILSSLHCSEPRFSAAHPHLLMVFNPHAERIDEDGDHDPPVKVFTLHNPLQLLSEAEPGPNQPVPVVQDALPSAAPSPASQIALGNRWEGFIQQSH